MQREGSYASYSQAEQDISLMYTQAMIVKMNSNTDIMLKDDQENI